jgi:diacylglycerol kinase family enzyme
VFVNPHAGQGSIGVDELRALLPEHSVEACEPAELGDRVRRAVEGGTEFVGVAGGDGTIATAAAELVGGEVPLLAIPGGTRNHFARALGLSTLDDAARAVTSGSVRSIDLGRVAERWFVNNASIGLYPEMVRRRELHERRFRKGISNVVAIWEQIRHGHRFVAVVDGERHRAWAIFVGNGRYGERIGDLAERESLDDGVLDVRIVRAVGRLPRTRVVGATLVGRLSSSPLVERTTAAAVCIDLGRRQVDVALDGEVVRLRPPLEFECRPRALHVLAPPADESAGT